MCVCERVWLYVNICAGVGVCVQYVCVIVCEYMCWGGVCVVYECVCMWVCEYTAEGGVRGVCKCVCVCVCGVEVAMDRMATTFPEKTWGPAGGAWHGWWRGLTWVKESQWWTAG